VNGGAVTAANVSPGLRAVARAINDAWLELAAEGVGWIEDRARETVIPNTAYDDIGTDALIERVLIPVTVRRTIKVLGVISPGLSDSVERLAVLLHEQPDAFLARLAAAACPPIVAARTSFVGWAHGDGGYAKVIDADEMVRGVAFYAGAYGLIPRLGSSYPALPLELVRPLARCLSGECRFGRASPDSTWTASLRGVPVGDLREDAVIARPRVNPHHLRESVSYPRVFDELGAAATHRLVRELVARGWEDAFIHASTEPGRVLIPGGWRKLADDLGVRGASGRDALRLGGALLSLLSVRLPGAVPTPLLHVHVRPNPDRQIPGRTCLDFKLVNELLPGAVRYRARSKGRLLAPLPPCLPPSPATKLTGRACSYQMLLVLEMRLRATEFTEDRTIAIPGSTRDRLAYDVGLTKPNRLAIEDAWFASGREQFLERDGGRLHLAPRYTTLDTFLQDSARRTESGRRRQKRRKKER
jgi:hypothetical protein